MKPDSRYLGKTMTQIRTENDAIYLRQPLTVYCAYCPWTHSAPASEAQAAFALHRAEAHGEIKVAKRQRKGFAMRLAAAQREKARESARRGGRT